MGGNYKSCRSEYMVSRRAANCWIVSLVRDLHWRFISVVMGSCTTSAMPLTRTSGNTWLGKKIFIYEYSLSLRKRLRHFLKSLSILYRNAKCVLFKTLMFLIFL